jgi:hypothetical protein
VEGREELARDEQRLPRGAVRGLLLREALQPHCAVDRVAAPGSKGSYAGEESPWFGCGGLGARARIYRLRDEPSH